ncbi:MAG: acyloxyacyl hydrolase [Algibacter sp.]|uniref:acyloxyacyl hydrolase n=1 Tax=Algibacter sp. TaxID=1872428 RepID=UPI0026148E7F|nr:acyloxyacyl hydrolase [Algibacter sp.]MDG1729893.1 acyloxyacyl hydrolase [Algibacter sp.]MDG2178971.1 acyloxyacyl hydrolase [Algibacter sp.]
MKQKFTIPFLIALFFIVIPFGGNAQIKKENLKWGFTYGTGSQNKFPFDAKDYSHEVDFYKIQINYRFKDKQKWAFEVNLEPSYNVVHHQLLNRFYVKPSDADNYQELTELYMQKRTIKEYVLNCGFIVRYKLYKQMSTYAIGSVGPMVSDKATERLAKGFAFSDIFGLGLSYEINKVQFDFRYSVRHTSNLELKQPNGGHNTSNAEFSLLFKL